MKPLGHGDWFDEQTIDLETAQEISKKKFFREMHAIAEVLGFCLVVKKEISPADYMIRERTFVWVNVVPKENLDCVVVIKKGTILGDGDALLCVRSVIHWNDYGKIDFKAFEKQWDLYHNALLQGGKTLRWKDKPERIKMNKSLVLPESFSSANELKLKMAVAGKA